MTRIRNQYILSFAVFAIGVLVSSVFFVLSATAALKDVQYPVQELGGCASEAACKTYCNNPSNITQCLAFAEKQGLMSKQELDTAKKFVQSGGGPGGCGTREECFRYCDDVSHIDECVAYGKKTGIMTPEELKEAEQVQAALKKGAKLPGGCTGKESCDSYCNDPSHMEECITFAEQAGFMDGGELQEAKKVLQAIKKGVKPPPCRGGRECDEYCTNPENIEACFTFAEAAGLLDEEELDEMRQVMTALKSGAKLPGGCRDKKSCDAYCRDPEHGQECMEFAIAAGFMTEEDAEMFRKTGGRGPGGCFGDECEEFCEDPENEEVCFEFAREHGLISEEELEEMEDGMEQAREAIEEAPDEVIACLEKEVGASTIAGLRAGTARPSQRIGDAMNRCFQASQQEGEGGYDDGGGGYYDDGGGYDEGFQGDENFDEEFDEFEDEEFEGNLLDKAKRFLQKLLRRD